MRIPELDQLRGWSRAAVVLRLLLAVAGGIALAAGWGGGPSPAPVLLGAVGLVAAVVEPGGFGPGVVLAGAALAWVVRYDIDPAPVGGTLLMALALAVHHQAAVLAAVLPPAARLQRAVLVRAGRHAVLVLGLSAVVAVLALALARPRGSVPLELLGLLAAVIAVAVPVLLARVRGSTPPVGRRTR